MNNIRATLSQHLPEGFTERMSYGMIGYVVPHSLYPKGYHVDPKLPLPFINLASQKNYIALYHMGLYSNQEVLDWFTGAWKEQVPYKLDMGKSCIRFKKMDNVPYDLIGELAGRISPRDWIALYEASLVR